MKISGQNILPFFLTLFSFTAYADLPQETGADFDQKQTDSVSTIINDTEIDPDIEALLEQAESRASPEGKKILATARSMIENNKLVRGSCWDYINAIYTRSGFADKSRTTIFKGKKSGRHADITLIEPGDWLYFINHSYGNIEHSSIFVEWIDFDRKEALMISYAGGNRSDPARYKSYDLSSVYQIMRPKSLEPASP